MSLNGDGLREHLAEQLLHLRLLLWAHTTTIEIHGEGKLRCEHTTTLQSAHIGIVAHATLKLVAEYLYDFLTRLMDRVDTLRIDHYRLGCARHNRPIGLSTSAISYKNHIFRLF